MFGGHKRSELDYPEGSVESDGGGNDESALQLLSLNDLFKRKELSRFMRWVPKKREKAQGAKDI